MLQNEEQELSEFAAGIRRILATGNRNPKRTDCARFTNRVRALAWHVKLGPDLEEVLEHISHCSPCFKDHRRHKTQYKLYRRCKRVAPYVAAAVVLLLLGIQFHALWKRQSSAIATGQGTRPSTSISSKENQVAEVQSPQKVTLNLESNLRGDDGEHPINVDLPRGRVQLTLQLPKGARSGRYLVRVLLEHGKPLLETEGVASTDERNVSMLRIDEIDTSKIIPRKVPVEPQARNAGLVRFRSAGEVMRNGILEVAVLILSCVEIPGTQQSDVQEFVRELMSVPSEVEQEQLLVARKQCVTVDTMKALILEGDRLHYEERYSETFTAYNLALEIANLIRDETSIARITRLMGDTRYFQGQYDSARGLYEKSLTLSERLQDKELMAYALLGLGNNQRDEGRYDHALEGFRKAQSLANEAAAKDLIALAANGVGSVQYLLGDYREAIQSYQDAYGIYDELRDKIGACRILTNIGMVYYQQGNYLKSLENYDKALKISEELQDNAYGKLILNNIALVYHMQGDFSQAWSIYGRTRKLLSSAHDPLGLGWLFHNMGHLSFLENRFARAAEYYCKSLSYADQLGNQELRVLNLTNLGDVRLALSDGQHSRAYYRQALAVQQQIGSREPLSRLMLSIGKSHFATREFNDALHYANRATDLAQELGSLEVLWKSRTLAGKSQIKLGRLPDAKGSFNEAITTIERLRNQLSGGAQDEELFFESKLAPYHEMVDLSIRQKEFRQAFSYVEQTKATPYPTDCLSDLF